MSLAPSMHPVFHAFCLSYAYLSLKKAKIAVSRESDSRSNKKETQIALRQEKFSTVVPKKGLIEKITPDFLSSERK